ncbi:MAG: carbohydrate ABC transporter permease [Chloroflexi bacterium]|nr:carbohydrate ABC transporter permease [Chloroflexota bacterium]
MAVATPAAQRSRSISTVLIYAVAALVVVVAIFPFYWLVITSVKPGDEVATNPPILIPTTLTIQNYLDVLAGEGVPRFALNSIVISLTSTALTIFIGSLAAYALAKTYLPYQVRHLLLLWILVTRIFPPITTAIPYFVLLRTLGLSDTYQGLIMTYVSYGLPFVIWLMLGFFQDMPPEIEEAAIVDGCSLWQRFRLVVMPLALPGLAVTAIFAFVYAWNEFLYASMLTSFNAKTLPVVISGYISDKFLRWGEMSALGTAMVLPVVLFSAFAQRYLVRGLTFGAVKE